MRKTTFSVIATCMKTLVSGYLFQTESYISSEFVLFYKANLVDSVSTAYKVIR